MLKAMVLSACLTGCAALPSHVEKSASYALADSGDTLLGRMVQARPYQERGPYDSGFFLLDNARLAFTVRLALVEAAQKTLDIQSYAVHSDETTERLLNAIRRAAARGVRVRILLDDFNTSGKNAQILKLAFLPHIELRLFNPLPGSRDSLFIRVLTSLHDVERIQRRMHNKLFIADNAMAIAGGRNLGETYFGQSEATNFVDVDVLGAGRIVNDLSSSFDQYWNDDGAFPAESLVSQDELSRLKRPPAPIAHESKGHEEASDKTKLSRKDLPLELGPSADLSAIVWTWAPAIMMVDKPSKIAAAPPSVEDAQDTVIDGLLHLLEQARKDILIVSPYFVPGPRMMSKLSAIRKNGVRIRVLTNSLASTDAVAAHVGYVRYRRDLLALGVELHELRAEQQGALAVFGSSTDSLASLHSKVLVVDAELIVIGSMNLDLRSQLQNTEVALVIRSPALALQAIKRIDPAMAQGAWRLELVNDTVIWRAPQGTALTDSGQEPDASLALRLLLKLFGPLAPDEML